MNLLGRTCESVRPLFTKMLHSKLPSLKQLAPVYALICVPVYYWSLLHFFWRVPSWVNYETPGEILVMLAYTLTANLLESLVVLSAPVILSLLLPSKWFHERFLPRALILVAFGLGYMLFLDKQIQPYIPFPYELVKWTPIIFAFILALVFVLDRFHFLGNLLAKLADSLTIFLYILIPASLLSLVIVLIRNLV